MLLTKAENSAIAALEHRHRICVDSIAMPAVNRLGDDESFRLHARNGAASAIRGNAQRLHDAHELRRRDPATELAQLRANEGAQQRRGAARPGVEVIQNHGCLLHHQLANSLYAQLHFAIGSAEGR